jgi:hypothetical protein
LEKLVELFSRIFSAGIRPVAIIWSTKYYPDITAAFFLACYVSPFIYKLASLSQINRYRRTVKSSGLFEVLGETFFFVIFIRMAILLLISIPVSIIFQYPTVSFFYLILFAISESFFLNREFINLCLGSPLVSSAYLCGVRFLQVALLVLTCVSGGVFSDYIISYAVFSITIVAFFLVRSWNPPKKRQILRNLKPKIYLEQLNLGAKELISIFYFTLSTILISAQADSFEHSYLYMIGFSVSGFFILFFRVIFVNQKVVKLTKSYHSVSRFEFLCFFFFVAGLSVIAALTAVFLGEGYHFLVPLVGAFSIFVTLNILNQRLLFFLASRRLPKSYYWWNLFGSGFLVLMLELVVPSSLYLGLAVVLPLATGITINYLFCYSLVRKVG